MSASPGQLAQGAAAAIGARAMAVATAQRTYVPRKIHVDWKAMHLIIGIASHLAWYKLVVDGRTGKHALRTPFNDHVQLTGAIAKEIVTQLVKSLGTVSVTIGTTASGTVTIQDNFGAMAGAPGGAVIRT